MRAAGTTTTTTTTSKHTQDKAEHVRQFGATTTTTTTTSSSAILGLSSSSARSSTSSNRSSRSAIVTNAQTNTTSSAPSLVDQLTGILAGKSSSLLGSLKQHYASFTATSSGTSTPSTMQTPAQIITSGGGGGGGSSEVKPDKVQRSAPASARTSQDSSAAAGQENQAPATPRRPPLPRPPPRELVQACQSASGRLTSPTTSDAHEPPTPAPSGTPPGRRHALQEHSLERDAALSLKSNTKELLKHKRTSSIRSALRHAHLPGALRSPASSSKRAAEKAAAAAALMAQQATGSCESTQSGLTGSGSKAVKSKPYELFEPPVTQRTFERSKRRRDAMLADPRRQMSADTMHCGLRQLTDEYLQNAGVQPHATTSGGSGATISGSLVALSGPLTSRELSATKPGTITVPGGSSTVAAIALASGQAAASSQAQCALEAQLYQATRQANLARESTLPSEYYYHHHSRTTQADPSARDAGELNYMDVAAAAAAACEEDCDSTSQVTMLPGGLPWQCDVSIQCELLQAPPVFEPYESTGDILNTIARPFRAPPLNSHSTTSFDTSGHAHHHHNHAHHHLSATLKRGLSAIGSQAHHHLSPGGASSTSGPTSMALNVVGSLKKSLSNTMFDVKTSGHTHAGQLGVAGAPNPFLRSQDSLPAYSSLQNEPDDDRGGGSERVLGRDDEGGPDGDDDEHQQQRRFANTSSVSLQAEVRPSGEQSATQVCCSSNQLTTGNEQAGGLIGQLASKLTRQSSKKFTVSKKGLQRALSFDYRGYKRLEGATSGQAANPPKQVQHQNTTGSALANSSAMQSSADSTGSSTSTNSNLFVTSRTTKQHNKSTLALQSPRPYLPQSASQVDFQVPLLPYDRMQEAIVSQRLLDGSSKAPTADTPTSSCLGGVAARDADELICGPPEGSSEVSDGDGGGGGGGRGDEEEEEEERHKRATRPQSTTQRQRASGRRREPPPRLVLNIPPASDSSDNHENGEDDDDNDEEEELEHNDNSAATTVISCDVAAESDRPFQGDTSGAGLSLTSGQMSQSPSFCIDPDGRSASLKHRHSGNSAPPLTPTIVTCDGAGTGSGENPSGEMQTSNVGNLLTASDVFNKSKNFIKRPSTMMAGDDGEDALNQVVQALESKQRAATAAALSSSPSVRARNRRQAIVPPKLATDACTTSSDSDVPCTTGTLVNLEDDDDDDRDDDQEHQRRRRKRTSGGASGDQFAADEEEALSGIRRKRSGGGIEKAPAPPCSLPTFHIEPEEGSSATPTASDQLKDQQRPDSQATNAESLVSSGSSTTLSAMAGGRMSAGGVPMSPSGASASGSLAVPFGSSGASGSRRRSSIAVIPQMQICPGDLLVYSKQLIERMNQSDEHEPPAQFLTIDDKKGKNNIWSSFKLCAQFDNRTMRARNELLCSLEDVLASLQPSTFVDEQLSHYKGMLWNEFLYETESHRSASSEGLNSADEPDDKEPLDQSCSKKSYGDDLVDVQISVQSSQIQVPPPPPACDTQSPGNRRSASVRGDESSNTRESLKLTMSGGGSGHASPARTGAGQGRNLSSRFREKPKLKRGQTVDSVFRIPLIPSSPLKHAQQHQQTPTAHLEHASHHAHHQHELNIIEDDERSSLGSGSGGGGGGATSTQNNKQRSSSTRSRSGSRLNELESSSNGRGQLTCVGGAGGNVGGSQESSFDADDAQDLVTGRQQQHRKQHLNQMVRQSSLSTLSSTITRTEQKRQRALWDLFQSECTFFFDHLMTLKNVYMEPLKKIQVEGFAMFADPDVLFGNLDELCCGVYDFCKEFLFIIMRTLKTRPEELNATDVLIKLYKKNPKIDHLRAVYHRYTLNYINALTYLESLRRQVEFVEFEKWSSRDVRCKKLQLTDLLVAPVQHIMRVPIILKDIETHTEKTKDRDEIRAILAVEEASLRELDDKMRWLKNFERLLEIQKNINWPSVFDMEAKLYVPEFLREVLSKQPCEKLIVSPRRQIVHEGTLSNLDASGKATDMHVILFDDMLLMTRRKKGLTKKASTVVCKTNSAGDHCVSGGSSQTGSSSMLRDDGSFKYVVYKQPLSLDRFYVHDVQQNDSQPQVAIKHLFLLIVMNRFQQIIGVHSFAAPNDDIKQTWLFKIKKTAERWKRNYSSSSGATESKQQQQQQQQQQHQPPAISTSKSMPMDPTSTSNNKRSTPRAAPSTPQKKANEQAANNAGQSARTPEPSATVQYQSRQQARYDDTQRGGTNGTQQQRQQQPIELVITSASESPDKCR